MFRILMCSAGCLMLAACGRAQATQPQYVDRHLIVAEAPVTEGTNCYLRVRPKEDEKAPPQILAFQSDHGEVRDRRFRVCTMSKVGDLYIHTEPLRAAAAPAS